MAAGTSEEKIEGIHTSVIKCIISHIHRPGNISTHQPGLQCIINSLVKAGKKYGMKMKTGMKESHENMSKAKYKKMIQQLEGHN